MEPRPARLGFILGLGLSATALAFNPGGHHDTLSAAFATAHASSADALADQRRLEAFCAQLPDLAEELDAVTQREHVVTSWTDLGWGGFGVCSTHVSTHMVASQFYLHGLTGARATDVREAARLLIAGLDADLARAADPAPRSQLICERGLAEHLLGDSFAHTDLHGDGGLYATGMGHARDQDTPDRMLRRPSLWMSWIQDVHDHLDEAVDGGALGALAAGVDAGEAAGYGEDELVARLHAFTSQPPNYWEPWPTPLDDWLNAPHSTLPLAGSLVDLYNAHIIQNTCQQQIDQGPANQNGNHGDAPITSQKLSCHDIWADYLRRAISAFSAQGLHPPSSCEPVGDQLEDGQ